MINVGLNFHDTYVIDYDKLTKCCARTMRNTELAGMIQQGILFLFPSILSGCGFAQISLGKLVRPHLYIGPI